MFCELSCRSSEQLIDWFSSQPRCSRNTPDQSSHARVRLACATAAAGLGIWLLDARVIHTGLPWVDAAIAFAPLSIAVTLFAVAGISNAINIIDGVNALASVCAPTMLTATALGALFQAHRSRRLQC